MEILLYGSNLTYGGPGGGVVNSLLDFTFFMYA